MGFFLQALPGPESTPTTYASHPDTGLRSPLACGWPRTLASGLPEFGRAFLFLEPSQFGWTKSTSHQTVYAGSHRVSSHFVHPHRARATFASPRHRKTNYFRVALSCKSTKFYRYITGWCFFCFLCFPLTGTFGPGSLERPCIPDTPFRHCSTPDMPAHQKPQLSGIPPVR